MSHRPFKQRLYAQFARVGNALASDKRLELIDLLIQAPRNVDSLASETEMPVATVSQHLQVLRNAKLVESERDGTKIVYRLADPRVLKMFLALRSVAETRLPEVEQLVREYGLNGDEKTPLSQIKLEKSKVLILFEYKKNRPHTSVVCLVITSWMSYVVGSFWTSTISTCPCGSTIFRFPDM